MLIANRAIKMYNQLGHNTFTNGDCRENKFINNNIFKLKMCTFKCNLLNSNGINKMNCNFLCENMQYPGNLGNLKVRNFQAQQKLVICNKTLSEILCIFVCAHLRLLFIYFINYKGDE